MINIHVQTEAKCHKRTKTIQGLQPVIVRQILGIPARPVFGSKRNWRRWKQPRPPQRPGHLIEHSTVPGQLETRVETETHVRFNWNFLPSSLFPWESTCFRCWCCWCCWCWCCCCCWWWWWCWCCWRCWSCWCCCWSCWSCWCWCCCCCSNKCCIIVWHYHVCEWFSIGRGHLSNYEWVQIILPVRASLPRQPWRRG